MNWWEDPNNFRRTSSRNENRLIQGTTATYTGEQETGRVRSAREQAAPTNEEQCSLSGKPKNIISYRNYNTVCYLCGGVFTTNNGNDDTGPQCEHILEFDIRNVHGAYQQGLIPRSGRERIGFAVNYQWAHRYCNLEKENYKRTFYSIIRCDPTGTWFFNVEDFRDNLLQDISDYNYGYFRNTPDGGREFTRSVDFCDDWWSPDIYFKQVVRLLNNKSWIVLPQANCNAHLGGGNKKNTEIIQKRNRKFIPLKKESAPKLSVTSYYKYIKEQISNINLYIEKIKQLMPANTVITELLQDNTKVTNIMNKLNEPGAKKNKYDRDTEILLNIERLRIAYGYLFLNEEKLNNKPVSQNKNNIKKNNNTLTNMLRAKKPIINNDLIAHTAGSSKSCDKKTAKK